MLQKLSFTFHHYQFIAKKNLIRAISGMHLLRTFSTHRYLWAKKPRPWYGASASRV